MKSLQLPVTSLAAAALPAGSRVATPNHPQFIICRRGERLSLPRLLLISLFAHFSVLQCHRLGFSTSPSSVLSTPATVDSATLRSCPPCRRRMSSLTHTSRTFVRRVRTIIYCIDYRSRSVHHRLLPLCITILFSIVLYVCCNTKPVVTAASVI